MKNWVLRICTLVLISLLCVGLVSCQEEKEIEIIADETFEIHTEKQKGFLENSYDLVSLYAKGAEELSKPNPVVVKWEIENASDVMEYKFVLSEFEDFSINRTFVVNTNEVSIKNLKIHTLYYWYVEYLQNNTVKTTPTKTFVIANKTPRNLDIEGLTNVRDLGGYKLGVNKYIKQGMIYRSSRLNENETTDLLITENGIKEMVDILGVKTELDIRDAGENENGGITVSPLGENVKYISISMKSGGSNYLTINKNVIKDVFSVFGQENNYPVVIHCSIGTDRTGLICFFINALLGASEEDLYRDYLFSNFGDIGRRRVPDAIDEYLKEVNAAKGNNLSEKTYNYLISIGVNSQDLDTIIRVMK